MCLGQYSGHAVRTLISWSKRILEAGTTLGRQWDHLPHWGLRASSGARIRAEGDSRGLCDLSGGRAASDPFRGPEIPGLCDQGRRDFEGSG